MTEEQKEKYANFLDKVSEILGLNKPVDILRLCAVTDEYLKPIEKRMTELEKENAVLKERNIKDCKNFNKAVKEISERLNQKHCQINEAKDLLLRFIELKNKPCAAEHSINMLLYENICAEAKQFLKETE